MSSQRVNLTTATPTQAGRISTIKLVSQSVTGPPGADGEGAPNSATYVTLSTNATLTGERVLTAGTGITLTDAGANSTVTVGVTAGTYATAAQGATADAALAKASNLSDLTSASTARANLGLGTAATTAATDYAAASHNQAASTITSGTIDTARLGSGSASASTYLRGDQTWAAVSAGAVDLGRPAKSGTIYPTIPGWWINGTANFAFSAGTVYYFPVVIEAAKTVTDVGIEVQTGGAAATTARLGIHTADTSWQPVAVALDAGTVATDSTGVKTVTGLSTALTAGRYLFTVWFSGGPTLRCLQGGPIGGALDSAGGTNPQIMLWRGASAYGGTYPATPVAWASVTGNTTAYAPMWAKFA